MARSQGNVTVTLSVLDRLIDKEPKNQLEAPLTRSQSFAPMKLQSTAISNGCSIRAEFSNCRRIPKEVNRSVYVYGLPDFSAIRWLPQQTKQSLCGSFLPRSSF